MGLSCAKWEMINWQSEQMPGKWRGNGGEEHRNCNGDCIESNIARVEKE